MTTLSIQPPFPLITDIDGQPLEDGYIWIGVANLPPIGNPIAVYWDAALTIPAALPIRTRGGYPVNAGTPARLYVGSDYSILVQNKNGSTLYSASAATERYSDPVVTGVSSAEVSFLQAGSGAVVRTAQSKMRDVVSILDFIPESEHAAIRAGTSTYDCRNALAAAIASVTTPGPGYTVAGPQVMFPPGDYVFNGFIDLKKQVRISGTVAGMPDGQPVKWKFPANSEGIIVNTYNTINGGVEVPPTIGADGSIIENITLQGGGGTYIGAHGIWLRARATIRNVTIRDFKGNGVHARATAGGGGALEGNCNNFRLDTLRIIQCGGSGVFVEGADANAGTIIGVDASSNQGWGIYDSSFLGNTYIGCHTDNNTLGAYKSDDPNARNSFLGCYAESGQPASNLDFPAMVVGGLHGAGITGTFINILEYPTRVSGSVQALTGQTITLQAGAVDPADSNVFQLTSSDEPSWPIRLKYRLGRWFLNWANTAFEFFNIYNEQATIANGYARNSSNGRIGMPSFYHGDYTQMKYRGVGSAAPTTGTWLQGDIVFNTAPTAGGHIGWVCTTAGTPGTWKTFGAITP